MQKLRAILGKSKGKRGADARQASPPSSATTSNPEDVTEPRFFRATFTRELRRLYPEAYVDEEQQGTVSAGCDVCHSAIDANNAEPFYMCSSCGIDPGFDVCQNCYKKGGQCPQAGHKPLQIAFAHGQPSGVISDHVFRFFRSPDAPHATHQDFQEIPLSFRLETYLASYPLGDHRFRDLITNFWNTPVGVANHPMSEALRNWGVCCLLVAGQRFDDIQPTFLNILLPVQKSSLALIKEWWFSEIQDPALMANYISTLIADLLVPSDNGSLHHWVQMKRGKYFKHYHGAMANLFLAEFQCKRNQPAAHCISMMNLTLKRHTAGVEACKQRMAYGIYYPDLRPSWFGERQRWFDEGLRIPCWQWKISIAESCSDFLFELNRICGSIESFWILLELATRGPIELWIANRLSAEQLLGQKRYTATLAPMSWLTIQEIHSAFPHFLWDVRKQRTVETRELNSRPLYLAISHTWGRWKSRSRPSLHIDGVPWPVPQNDLWDVADIAQQMRKVPGGFDYVWFDLLCIPQDPKIAGELYKIGKSEISKQAAIFGNATRVIAWLSDVKGFPHLQILLSMCSMACGRLLAGSKADMDAHNEREKRRAPAKEDILGVFELLRGDCSPNMHPKKMIHPWFTSLWTLQEACMRPDMWICQRDWKPLRHWNSEAWKDNENISLDGLVAVVDGLDTHILARKSQGATSPLELLKILEAPSPEKRWRENARIVMESLFNRADAARNGSPEVAMRTGECHGTLKSATWAMSTLYGMFLTMGILTILRATPMQIMLLADRRECKRSRAEAIMAVVGAPNWWEGEAKEELEKEHYLVLGRYPLAFLQAVRRRVGDAEFFKSRYMPRIPAEFFDAESPNEQMLGAVGTLMPFGSDLNMSFSPPGVREDPFDRTTHPSLTHWQILQTGMVKVSQASIVLSSHSPDHTCGCLHVNIHEARTRTHDTGEPFGIIEPFVGNPGEWLGAQRNTCYVVSLDYFKYFSEMLQCTINASNVLVLQELRKGLLFKVGEGTAWGLREHISPASTAVEWSVI